jgi:hypothetical protein
VAGAAAQGAGEKQSRPQYYCAERIYGAARQLAPLKVYF